MIHTKGITAIMKTNPVPKGYHTITPCLIAKGTPKVIDFMKRAFNAEEIEIHTGPDGSVMHAQYKIGDSIVMLGEARGEHQPLKSMLYLYVSDADKVFQQAVKGGGKVVAEMKDQFYGDRSGGIEDPVGNQWWIASRKEDLSPEDIKKRMATAKK